MCLDGFLLLDSLLFLFLVGRGDWGEPCFVASVDNDVNPSSAWNIMNNKSELL